MSLTIKEVEHLAKLAKIQLKEEEKEKYAQEVSVILDYVKKINQAAKDNPLRRSEGEASHHLMDGTSGQRASSDLRPDEVVGISLAEQEAILGQAPTTEGRLIKTKAVFE